MARVTSISSVRDSQYFAERLSKDVIAQQLVNLTKSLKHKPPTLAQPPVLANNLLVAHPSNPGEQVKQARIELTETPKHELVPAKTMVVIEGMPKQGKVELKVEEGERVLKTYDSKDILIYQVPTKGAMHLISTQDVDTPPKLLAVA